MPIRSSNAIKAEIEERFGFFPPFFEPAMETPGVLENLWQQTLAAYVGNPMPATLKEKLFAYLSRFCGIPYCIVCHSCALKPLGLSATEIVALLERPSPDWMAECDRFLIALPALAPLKSWDEVTPELETAFLAASVAAYLEPDRASALFPELRRVFPKGGFAQWVAFLGYVKNCHHWVEAHPELTYTNDERVRANLEPLLEDQPQLGRLFENYTQLAARERSHEERALRIERDKLRENLEIRNAELERRIEERTRAEKAMAEAQARLSDAIESISDGFALFDADDRMVLCNEKYRKAYREQEDLLVPGVRFEEIVRILVGAGVIVGIEGDAEDWIEERMQRHRAPRSEFELSLNDGRWMQINEYKTMDGATVVIRTDITERRRADERLRAALDTSHQRAGEVGALLEASRTVLEAGDFETTARRIFGVCKRAIGATGGYVALLSPDGQENEVLFLNAGGRPCNVNPDLPMPIRGLREQAYRLGKAVYDNDFSGSPWVGYLPDGHAPIENVLFSPLVIDGEAAGLIGLANKEGGFDEDDARLAGAIGEFAAIALRNARTLDALHEAKEEAVNANQAKSKFLATASHDLRQPLHAIGLFLDSLSRKFHDDDSRRIIDSIERSLESLNQMFEQLLDISRLDAGVLEPTVSDFPVARLFDVVEGEFGRLAAEKGLALRVVPSRAFVRSDPALLERIVRNLLANAVSHTSEGWVLVGCRYRGQHLRIEVWDSGEGIPPEQLSEIFREFHQIGRIRRGPDRGLGLGLAIVDRLARLLDHAVDVRSAPGKGSVFAVDVPVGIEADPPAERRSARLVAGEVSGALIAVVEDDAEVLRSTETLLDYWGCRVMAATTTGGLLTLLTDASKCPDLIIADYRLRGGESGIQAIEQIRKKCGRRIPAVVVSGDTAPDRLREVQASGHRMLHKPLRPAKLRSTIVVMLNEWVHRAD